MFVVGAFPGPGLHTYSSECEPPATQRSEYPSPFANSGTASEERLQVKEGPLPVPLGGSRRPPDPPLNSFILRFIVSGDSRPSTLLCIRGRCGLVAASHALSRPRLDARLKTLARRWSLKHFPPQLCGPVRSRASAPASGETNLRRPGGPSWFFPIWFFRSSSLHVFSSRFPVAFSHVTRKPRMPNALTELARRSDAAVVSCDLAMFVRRSLSVLGRNIRSLLQNPVLDSETAVKVLWEHAYTYARSGFPVEHRSTWALVREALLHRICPETGKASRSLEWCFWFLCSDHRVCGVLLRNGVPTKIEAPPNFPP